MSNFGKAQLLKYGWSEGKGLGKNENGIAEALKPKLKFDTSGIGHKDTDFQWWSSVYDKALKNVVSEKDADKVSINIIKENAFNISSTQAGLEVSEKKVPLQYGKFLKTSTLKDGSLIRDKNCAVIEEKEKEEISFTQITDEELFKACGGRTAHKGARHGLKLSGKLARIAEQEKKLLAAQLGNSTETSSDSNVKSKKSRKRKMVMDLDNVTIDTVIDRISDDEDNVIPLIPDIVIDNQKLSKKSSRKLKRKVNDLSHQLSKSSLLEEHDECAKNENVDEVLDKPSKKSIKKSIEKMNELSNQLSKSCLLEETGDDQYDNADECQEQSSKSKKKSKKKKHKRKLNELESSNGIENIQLHNEIIEPCSKKSKKHRKKSMESETNDIETDKESENSKHSFPTWKNAKIKSKKLKKYEKKKNKLAS